MAVQLTNAKTSFFGKIVENYHLLALFFLH
jgi:hypothetical protein